MEDLENNIKSKVLVAQELEDLEEEFSYLETPMEKMEFIIDFAKETHCDESLISDSKYLVEGCVSRAYLKIDPKLQNSQEGIELSFFVDAMIIKGFLSMIKQILDSTKKDELNENLSMIENFSSNVGLESFLSPNRSNALHNIFKKIKQFS